MMFHLFTYLFKSRNFIFVCLLTCCYLDAQDYGNSSKNNTRNNRYQSIQNSSFHRFATVYLDSANYYSNKNPFRAIDFINKAIGQSITEKDKNTESSAYLILGNIQQRLGQHDLAIENYKKCINASTTPRFKGKSSYSISNNQNNMFYANRQMAVSYLELNDLANANFMVTSCLNISSMPREEILSVKRIQAAIKLKENKTTESITLLNEVLNEEKEIGNIVGEIETYLVLGDIYQGQNSEDKALENYSNAKTLAEKNNQSKLALTANERLAKIFRKQKNVVKELETRNSKIQINTSENNQQAVIKENIEIGNAYQNTAQFELADSYYTKGITQFNNQTTQASYNWSNDKNLFGRTSDLEETANTYKLLAENYLNQKDLVMARDYFDKYAILQDSIKNVRKRELDEAINISNNLGKNQQRMDLLEKERQLSEKSLEVLKKDQDLKEEQLDFKNVVIGVLVFFLLFMLLAGYFLIRSAAEKRKVNQLLALKSLRGQMNPHFIFNALNSVNHYISQNDERKANRYLSDFSKLMRMVMDSSKHSLVPLNDELDMLRLYLQLEHTRFSDKFDYTLEISETINEEEFELPPMLIQPYLENAIWHGLRYLDHPGKLSIYIIEKDNELLVSIMDNGIGRNKSKELKTSNQKKQASIGMQNIENRLVIMNELFETNIRVLVDDAYPGELNCGTKINLFIPQHKHAHA